MSRTLSLGNGKFLVNIDNCAQVRDVFFPHVGLENHVGGTLIHRIGLWVDGQFAWTSAPEWQIKPEMAEDTLAGRIEAVNPHLQVKLIFVDLVHNDQAVFMRRVEIYNLADTSRTIKLYFNQEFEMYQSRMAHTAYFDPANNAIIHYRNQRVFLVNAHLAGKPFGEYSTGVFGSEGKQGTHFDAIDGQLSGNSIEHGRADSVLALGDQYHPGEVKVAHYWLVAAKTIEESIEINRQVISVGVGHMMESAQNYWRAWVNRRKFSFYGLSPQVIRLFKQSLLIARTQADDDGGIIASCDFTILHQGKDTYNYIWPRDASFTALALSKAGDVNVAKNFFKFCNAVINSKGYFMHKYSPDKSLGSSWHPWVRNGRPELPIQEDETALVLVGLWHYYEQSQDLEFIEEVYDSLIKKAADFMVMHRDLYTGLPKPSYDLWEEKFGVSTFTASSVYAALVAASRFAKLLGKVKNEDLYHKTAEEIKVAILKYLYNETDGYFYKMINFYPDEIICDPTIDISSAYGVYAFGILPSHDPRVKRMMEITAGALTVPSPVGGIARYQNDGYCRRDPNYVGNPWFVATLWLTQYYIQIADSESDLEKVKSDLEWVVKHAQPSGVLSEQLDPEHGGQLSVAPLTWSHAEYILTVIQYLERLEELGIHKAINPDEITLDEILRSEKNPLRFGASRID